MIRQAVKPEGTEANEGIFAKLGSTKKRPPLAIATDHDLDFRAPEPRQYNNVSAGRRLRGYQKQFARAYRGISQGHIDPDNRSIREYCNCGSKVAGRILTDLVDRYPGEFERSASGRVKLRSVLAA